jgi:hypothetical protein
VVFDGDGGVDGVGVGVGVGVGDGHGNGISSAYTQFTPTHLQENAPERFKRVVAGLPLELWGGGSGSGASNSSSSNNSSSSGSSSGSREGGTEEWPRMPVFLQRNIEVNVTKATAVTAATITTPTGVQEAAAGVAGGATPPDDSGGGDRDTAGRGAVRGPTEETPCHEKWSGKFTPHS